MLKKSLKKLLFYNRVHPDIKTKGSCYYFQRIPYHFYRKGIENCIRTPGFAIMFIFTNYGNILIQRSIAVERLSKL
jgi:hypothetical protein